MKKRLWGICLLALMLLCAGCAASMPSETTTAATTQPVPTTEYVPREPVQPEWTEGSFSKNGAEVTTNSVLRTTDYLLLADYGGAVVNPGYLLSYYVFDENRNYLGTDGFLKSGEGFSLAKIREAYPEGVYFRVALDTVDQTVLTPRHAALSHVTFYGPGEAAPELPQTVSYENVAKMSACQDGAIYDGKLFLFTAGGTCTAYDVRTGKKTGYIYFSSTSPLIPHANSVCFGNTFYAEGDKYPLLYANIYNNYTDRPDRMEGTCCVFRLTENGKFYNLDLVQVIRVGFAKDVDLWLSASGNSAPYGNFIVDTDRDKLYAYVMRNESNSTRFFEFDLPALTAGEYHEAYGCNVVTLGREDYDNMFDVDFSFYIQGGCYRDGKVISIEGMDSGSGKEPALRIIDLESGTLEATYYLAEAGLFREPEMISFDPDTGVLYYSGYDGHLRILHVPGLTESK